MRKKHTRLPRAAPKLEHKRLQAGEALEAKPRKRQRYRTQRRIDQEAFQVSRLPPPPPARSKETESRRR
jgi:hypothetical protein